MSKIFGVRALALAASLFAATGAAHASARIEVRGYVPVFCEAFASGSSVWSFSSGRFAETNINHTCNTPHFLQVMSFAPPVEDGRGGSDYVMSLDGHSTRFTTGGTLNIFEEGLVRDRKVLRIQSSRASLSELQSVARSVIVMVQPL